MWQRYTLVVLALVAGNVFDVLATSEDLASRERVISVFEVVKFANDPCNTTSTQGTCYTAEECTTLEGTASGSCAGGYGVCCVFTRTCGQRTSQNCTFFMSSNVADNTACKLEVCPSNNNICQLRLDFVNFVTNPPVTNNVAAVTKLVNGANFIGTTVGLSASLSSRCLTDSFSVTSPGNTAPPTICGTNSGQHMIVEASDCCNVLSFNFGMVMGAGAGVTRSFNVKISQYSCDYINLAPEGCTKYFFGMNSATVMTYNFQNGQGSHLADQREKFCIRRESNNCQVCWNLAKTDVLDISGTKNNAQVVGNNNLCCGQGTQGTPNMLGFDCLVIPGASTMNKKRLPVDEWCGGGKVQAMSGLFFGTATISTPGHMRGPVCSRKLPFVLSFYSDSFELAANEATTSNRGFSLTYTLMGCP